MMNIIKSGVILLAMAVMPVAAGADAPKQSPTPVTMASKAPKSTPLPSARPDKAKNTRKNKPLQTTEGILRKYPSAGKVGFQLFNLETGKIIESHNADQYFIPASTLKVATAQYALETLGSEYRFKTRLMTTGKVVDGTLKGDLYLVGGNDPVLNSDHLAEMVEKLIEDGVKKLEGRFYYDSAALTDIEIIDPLQPAHAAYNPSIGALNANFNRVMLQWQYDKKKNLTLEARAHARNWAPIVTAVSSEIMSDAGAPMLQYQNDNLREIWRISKRAMRKKGRRWLPIRHPAPYAASIFQAIAAEKKLSLTTPRSRLVPKKAITLQTHESAPLDIIIAGMLKFSTNLTAEMLGLSATLRREIDGSNLSLSGEEMKVWMAGAVGKEGFDKIRFDNHSGLSSASRISPEIMGKLLQHCLKTSAERTSLPILLSNYKLHERKGEKKLPRASIRAKTGTMYFGRGLAGYIAFPNKPSLGFAIYFTDTKARAALDKKFNPLSTAEPASGKRWLQRARAAEKAVLRGWIRKYSG